MARFGNYEDYLKRRWIELRGEDATDAARHRTGVFREQDMGWDNEATHPLAEQRAEEFKKAQMPIFVQIAGELHHALGHKDVGLGKKNSGNRWELEGDDVATDIIVLKDLDGGGGVQLVDCFSSMGGPETKPMWAEIEPNSDRSFVVPPVPAGPVTDQSHGQSQGQGQGQGQGQSQPSTAALEARIQALEKRQEEMLAQVDAKVLDALKNFEVLVNVKRFEKEINLGLTKIDATHAHETDTVLKLFGKVIRQS
jgi:hypothetical protein